MQGTNVQCRAAIAAMALAIMAPLPMADGSALAREAAITADDMARHIRFLASDELLGRYPGTRGEEQTLDYLAARLAESGWRSGTNNPASPWFQPVPMVERTMRAQQVSAQRRGRALSLPANGAVFTVEQARIEVADAPLVFVGHGLMPDDPALETLAGKAVLMLPGPGPGELGERGEDERREDLMRAGAAVVASLVSTTELEQLRQKARRASMNRAGPGDRAVAAVGAVDAAWVRAALRLSQRGFETLIASARQPGFAPVATEIRLSLSVDMIERRFTSHNLLARLPGRRPDGKAVMLVAHWDHLGICIDTPQPDRVCNGAVDNASGLAAMLEIGRVLARGAKPDRDIILLATTGEEQGLLGMAAFAEDPPLPLADIVAAFNLDMVAVAGPEAPVAIVGAGLTAIDEPVRRMIRKQGRAIAQADAAASYLRRQDGWLLLQRGVPMLMINSAFADDATLARFLAERYHGIDDEFDGTQQTGGLELGGAVADALLHVDLVRFFASRRDYPVPAAGG